MMETMNTVANTTVTPRRKQTGRLAEVRAINKKKGWDPMTSEEKKMFDEAMRMITNL